MRINSLRYTLVLTACLAVSTNFVFAQQINKSKREAPNIAINISSNRDSVKTSYFNLGLISNLYNQRGIGLNVISSAVKNNMTGIQASGFVNITRNRANGVMLSGITNIVGNKANGVMVTGLINVTGKEANGMQASLFANIVGNRSNGLAIGGLMNVSGKEMDGLHIGGLANVSGISQKGIALAGLMNATANRLNGLQVASILNIAGKENKGAQLSLISNVGVEVRGVQATVLTNIAADTLRGFQLAGAVNIAVNTRGAFQLAGITNISQGRTKGVQLAPGNYAGGIDGVQIGILNMSTGKSNGFQVGVVNYSKDSTTHKIGLVNVNPKTRIQMMAFTGNTSKMNIAARFKNRKTYSIIGVGTQYLGLNDKFSGAVFYKTGLYFPIAKYLEISGDLGFYHIESFSNENEKTPKRMYSLQGEVNLEYRLQKKISIFASGGYSMTRYYDENKFYEKKPIFSLGVVLF